MKQSITKSTEKPKVLILGPLPPPYMGPSIATNIILKSSLNRDFILYHLNTNTHTTLTSLGDLTLGRLLKNLNISIKMIRIIKNSQPDLVVIPISQTTPGFIKDSVFIIISKLFRRRILLQLRGSNFRNWLKEISKITKAYVGMVLHSAQGVIVLGESLKYLFSDFFKDTKIFVVPNGANFEIMVNNRRSSTKAKLKLLYLSNIQLSKGIVEVLNAMLYLKKKYVNLKCEIDVVGNWLDEKTKSNCIRIVKVNKLPVVFHPLAMGRTKWKFFLNADLFIFPPRDPEGHPWVIVEAMAAGLPIISTDQGAIRESVIDGVNGFIVEQQNPKQIAEKIKILIENPGIRNSMGQTSRQLYLKNFTEEKMVEHLSYAFNEVLAR